MKAPGSYKTPEKQRSALKARRDAIKAAGGAEYEAVLARGRSSRARFRKRHPEAVKAANRCRKRTRPWRSHIVRQARIRARKRGLEATISASDLYWPTHCPVLGIELKYPNRTREGGNSKRPDAPSLDRWDNTKGYVPGNVFVISMRANTLKNDATWQELQAIVRYARDGLSFLRAVA